MDVITLSPAQLKNLASKFDGSKKVVKFGKSNYKGSGNYKLNLTASQKKRLGEAKQAGKPFQVTVGSGLFNTLDSLLQPITSTVGNVLQPVSNSFGTAIGSAISDLPQTIVNAGVNSLIGGSGHKKTKGKKIKGNGIVEDIVKSDLAKSLYKRVPVNLSQNQIKNLVNAGKAKIPTSVRVLKGSGVKKELLLTQTQAAKLGKKGSGNLKLSKKQIAANQRGGFLSSLATAVAVDVGSQIIGDLLGL